MMMMKGGKDEEKPMSPLFPRLHVNDKEKGGPKAPPRNKMALYEQFSIPSQKFTNGSPSMLPRLPNTDDGTFPSASSTHGLEKTVFSSFCNTPASISLTDKPRYYSTNGVKQPTFYQTSTTGNSSSAKNPSAKKFGNEDEFRGKWCSNGPPSMNSLKQVEAAFEKTRQMGIVGMKSKHVRNPNEDVGSIPSTSTKIVEVSSSNPPARDKILEQLKWVLKKSSLVDGLSRFRDTEPQEKTELRNGSEVRVKLSSNGLENGGIENAEKRDDAKKDDASDTSILDSVSVSDISPDDVVGVIGRDHFWEARKAIANQEKLFALQLFELHRIIKVQRSIAGSPNILLEDNIYFGKPTLPAKKLLIESSPHVVQPNNDSHKPNVSIEGVAENAIGKTIVTKSQNPVHFPANQTPRLTPTADANPGPWSYPSPPGNQWLVPVMSPSEGLIYKPYAGPTPPTSGFIPPPSLYGACSPVGPTPVGPGDFSNPFYGGIGMLPGPYFPPYGMSFASANFGSSGEQIGPYLGAQSILRSDRSSACQAGNFRPTKDSELHGSTVSGPHEKAKCDELPLFPMGPTDRASLTCSIEQQTQVIKVVPHKSAAESAARIFRSIQEERKHID